MNETTTWRRCICKLITVKRGWWIFSKIEVRRDSNPECRVKHFDYQERPSPAPRRGER